MTKTAAALTAMMSTACCEECQPVLIEMVTGEGDQSLRGLVLRHLRTHHKESQPIHFNPDDEPLA